MGKHKNTARVPKHLLRTRTHIVAQTSINPNQITYFSNYGSLLRTFMTSPPTPSHLLRTHTAAITSVSFSFDNERLYSGDAEGTVVVTSTRSLRPLTQWKAHTNSILGVEEWAERVITYDQLPHCVTSKPDFP